MARQRTVLGLIATLVVCLAPVPVLATTHVVDQTLGPYTSIAPAIAAASSGDTVLIMPGMYTGTGNTNLDTAGKSIVITGSGTTQTTIDCEATGPSTRAFHIHSGEDTTTVVSHLTIARGYSPHGGGIYCQSSSPKIAWCVFQDCGVAYGGGVKLENSSAIVDHCDFQSCWSFVSGAAMFIENASPTIRNTSISTCSSGFHGGAVMHLSGGGATFRSVTFEDCFTTSGDGGACYFQEVSPVLIDCSFAGNRADTTSGGAIYTSCDTELTECVFEGNGSGSGGAIYCYEAQLTMTGGECTGDTASVKGGAVCAVGAVLDIDGTFFTANVAPVGGALHLDGGTHMISNADISGNTGHIFGGGANCWDALATFDGCSFTGNQAGYDGGGLCAGYTVLPDVIGCVFRDNEADGQGGAIAMVEGNVFGSIGSSVFVGNGAPVGAALCMSLGASPPITGCTFSGNVGTAGEAAAHFDDSSSNVTNTILAFTDGASASSCGGAHQPTFRRCCVYGNAGGDSLCGDHASNLFLDPLFCDGPTTDVGLHDDSPCLPTGNPWSERIGAEGAGGCGPSTGVDGPPHGASLVLFAPMPNPSSGPTTLSWTLPSPSAVELVVYNVRGERVRTLLTGTSPAGPHSAAWDGSDDHGVRVSSGVYFVRLRAGSRSAVTTLVRIL